MDNYLDSEVSDSANEIAEAVFTATREHFKGLLPHQEQWLIRGIADVVYLKLRTIYEQHDRELSRADDDARKSADEYSASLDRAKDAELRLANHAIRLTELMGELRDAMAMHNQENGNATELKRAIARLSA